MCMCVVHLYNYLQSHSLIVNIHFNICPQLNSYMHSCTSSFNFLCLRASRAYSSGPCCNWAVANGLHALHMDSYCMLLLPDGFNLPMDAGGPAGVWCPQGQSGCVWGAHDVAQGSLESSSKPCSLKMEIPDHAERAQACLRRELTLFTHRCFSHNSRPSGLWHHRWVMISKS